MKHKLFLLLAAIGMMVPQLAFAANINIMQDHICYSLNKETLEATVTGTDLATGELVIADSIVYDNITYIVREIGDGAFKLHQTGSISIICPNTLRKIGNEAFYNSYFDIIKLNEGLEYIGNLAFGQYTRISKGRFILPEGLTYLSYNYLGVDHFPSTLKQIDQLQLTSHNGAWYMGGVNSARAFTTPYGVSTFYYFMHNVQLPCVSYDSKQYTPTIYLPDAIERNEKEGVTIYKPIATISGDIVDATFTYCGKLPSYYISNNVAGTTTEVDDASQCEAGEHKYLKVYFVDSYMHQPSDIPCHFTITKAPLVIAAKNFTRKYGENNPTLTCDYTGFVNGETNEVLTALPVLSTTANQSSKPGIYPINIYGATAKNYEISYQTGTLTIEKADQTITWEQNFSNFCDKGEIELTATASSNEAVSYTVSDESIAQIVSRSGKTYLQALKPGKVVVCAIQNGSDCYNPATKIEREIEIKPLLVSSINLNLTNLSLNIGGSVSLYATVTPTNATNPAVIWSSSDEKVLTVDNGEVLAVGVGKAVITATTTDGSELSASCNITVKPILTTDLSLSNNSLTIEEGGTDIIIATVSPANATTKTLLWTSSNEKVATVSDGVVTAVGQGVAIITAATTDGTNLSAQCKVTVTPSTKTPITLNQAEATMKANDMLTLVASLEGKALNSSELTWRSSNESVASVINGVVTAKSVGETTIVGTMTDGSNRSAMCRVVVEPTLVENVQMNINEVGLEVGMTLNLTATVLPETATGKTLSWASSNEVVASVSQTGTVVALAEGATNITASATDGSKAKATCTVIVGNPDAITLINCYKEQGARVYDMTGRLLESPVEGINIIKMPDGTTKKVLMR